MGTYRQAKRSDFGWICDLSEDLYARYNDEFFPHDRVHFRAFLNQAIADRRYFKIGEHGWMMAIEGHGNHHSPIRAVSQIYYHSNITGVKAVHELRDFHRDFREWVEKKGFHIAVTSSTLHNQSVFQRVLEKDGWTPVASGRLVWPTRHHPSR
jgi:hypothetical protein